MAEMVIEFHGVRGSLPAPGPSTASVGGNTSCVEVRLADRQILLDAGTGVRAVGDRLMGTLPVRTTILLSHLHWDHIQGLPFFAPIYVPGNRIEIVGGPNGALSLHDALARQMVSPFFPVALDDVPSNLVIREVQVGDTFPVGPATVRVGRLNHPDPVHAYRIEFGGRSVVYATDTEHFSCVDPHLARLAAGADVLIYDAQYLPDEYAGTSGAPRVGWGHSTWKAAVELASAARVGQLILFHHDPRRTDGAVDEIEAIARKEFPNTHAAREGWIIRLSSADAVQEAAAAC